MSDDAEAAYARLGDFVWTRFRLLGVPRPQHAALAWFRDPAHSWVGDGSKTSLTRLLLEVTESGLAAQKQSPESASGGAFFANARQVARILDAPGNVRKALLLMFVDGMELDDVAKLLGMTATAVKFAVNDVDDELDELGDLPPEGSLDDDHLSTIQLYGFALEVLDTLQMEQYEQHLASCSSCFQRFDHWSKNREAFEALPKPVPPKKKSNALPLLVAGFAMLVMAGGITTLVAFALATQKAEVEATTWKGEAAVVELRTGAGPITNNEVELGDVIQIWLDPHHAGHAGFAHGHHSQLREVLAVRPVERGGGLQLAPVELLVTEEGAPTIWVLVSNRPMSETGVREAIESNREDIAVTKIDLVMAAPVEE